MSKKITILGAGSWGTALALSLSRKGNQVKIWDRDETHLNNLVADQENKKYLPGIPFNKDMQFVKDVEEAVSDAELAVYVIPAQGFRGAFENSCKYLNKEAVVVNCAKGIEQKTLMTMSAIAREIKPDVTYAVISGPSHAEEVGLAMPTTVTAAADDIALAQYVQDVFISETLRVYTNQDITGVELGGALKNIIALGAGISDGMGFGDNAKAAMMTRGLTEIARLGIQMGAERRTFMGLAGVGDLIVTCTSMHSRNRRCGILIGEGLSPEDATAKIGMVVEGMYTTEAAYGLAQKYQVEMPITQEIYKVIKGQTSAKEAVTNLMTRQRRHEDEESDLI